MKISIKYKDWVIETHENFKNPIVESLAALQVAMNMQKVIRGVKNGEKRDQFKANH